MSTLVCKFGGSSLASTAQFHKAREIIQSDANRKFIVVSAPGKRDRSDQKITDLLYLCHAHAQQGIAFDEVFALIAKRYLDIVSELELDLDMQSRLDEVQAGIAETAAAGEPADYAASRGEYLNAHIMAKLLGVDCIDAAEIIFFGANGRLDEKKTYATMSARLQDAGRAVIGGFFGSLPDGRIKTFSRGGSDVTGAIVARAANADVYENWTDVSGLLMADPRIIDNPKPIETVTYRELRELAYMGASVLHDEAVFPVRETGIPVNIRNTNEPAHPGTMIISSDNAPQAMHGAITGIAGRKDFTVVLVEKALMNAEIGFGRRLLGAFEAHGVSYEHTPSGIDTMSVVVADSELDGKLDDVVAAIHAECNPDAVHVYPNMALIATVGRGMAHTPGMAAKLFTALAQEKVNIRMIDQGSSELNIIVGVEADGFEKGMRAIYNAFVA